MKIYIIRCKNNSNEYLYRYTKHANRQSNSGRVFERNLATLYTREEALKAIRDFVNPGPVCACKILAKPLKNPRESWYDYADKMGY